MKLQAGAACATPCGACGAPAPISLERAKIRLRVCTMVFSQPDGSLPVEWLTPRPKDARSQSYRARPYGDSGYMTFSVAFVGTFRCCGGERSWFKLVGGNLKVGQIVLL